MGSSNWAHTACKQEERRLTAAICTPFFLGLQYIERYKSRQSMELLFKMTKTPKKLDLKAAKNTVGHDGDVVDARALRGMVTRELLLDASERLIGELGLDGISMRQLGAMVGQANTAVIQYHFENKEGLVRAIMERRARQLAPIREEMLARAKADGKTGDVATLLGVFLLPIASLKDDDGRYVYAAFMVHGLNAFVRTNMKTRNFFWFETGAIDEVRALLQRIRPELDDERLRIRIMRLSRQFVNALVDYDHMRDQGERFDPESYFLQDLINMATAAFNTPLPASEKIEKPHESRKKRQSTISKKR